MVGEPELAVELSLLTGGQADEENAAMWTRNQTYESQPHLTEAHRVCFAVIRLPVLQRIRE